MTFTEAAVEVLRRAGKPLHFKEIADAALRENLLSHVGQDPEITMGRRLQDQGRKGQRRFPPPAEVVFEALAQRQTGAVLAELAADLLHRQLLSDALVRDLPSLVAALLEDNRRRTEAGRKPAFIVDGDRVTLVEFPPPSALLEEARAPHVGARPMGAAQLGAEVRRAVIRALRRRVAELDTGAFENLCAALLEKMGMRDVRVAKRSKEGPLYLARQRRGVSDLRVAVKLVRGGREIGRADVQELRKDLAHYSAQMGLVLAPGDAGRDARSEASAAAQAPVALYVGEALPEEMIACRVGVTVQTVEVPDLDEAFFAGLLRHREDRGEIRERKREREERPAAAQEEAAPPPPVAESTAIASAGASGTGEPEAAPKVAPEEVPSEAQPEAETAAPGAEGEEPR